MGVFEACNNFLYTRLEPYFKNSLGALGLPMEMGREGNESRATGTGKERW